MHCRQVLLRGRGRLIHSSLEKYVFHGEGKLALKPLTVLCLLQVIERNRLDLLKTAL